MATTENESEIDGRIITTLNGEGDTDIKVFSLMILEDPEVMVDDRDEIKIFYGSELIAHGPRGGHVGTFGGYTELKLFTISPDDNNGKNFLEYYLSPEPVRVEVTYDAVPDTKRTFHATATVERIDQDEAEHLENWKKDRSICACAPHIVFINTVLENGVPAIRRGVFSQTYPFGFDEQWSGNDSLSKLQPRFKRLPKHEGDYALVRARQDMMYNLGGPLSNWFRREMHKRKGEDAVDIEWDASCTKDTEGRHIYEITVYAARCAEEQREIKRRGHSQTWDTLGVKPFKPPIVYCSIVNGKKRRRCVAELNLVEPEDDAELLHFSSF